MDQMQKDLAQKDDPPPPQSELLILYVTETGFILFFYFFISKKQQAFSFFHYNTNSDLKEKCPRLPVDIHQIKPTNVNCIFSFWHTFPRLFAKQRH